MDFPNHLTATYVSSEPADVKYGLTHPRGYNVSYPSEYPFPILTPVLTPSSSEFSATSTQLNEAESMMHYSAGRPNFDAEEQSRIVLHGVTGMSPGRVADTPSFSTAVASPVNSDDNPATPYTGQETPEAAARRYRRECRRAQNRISQRKFRARKEAKLKEADEEVARLEGCVQSLEKRNKDLEATNADLLHQITNMERFRQAIMDAIVRPAAKHPQQTIHCQKSSDRANTHGQNQVLAPQRVRLVKGRNFSVAF